VFSELPSEVFRMLDCFVARCCFGDTTVVEVVGALLSTGVIDCFCKTSWLCSLFPEAVTTRRPPVDTSTCGPEDKSWSRVWVDHRKLPLISLHLWRTVEPVQRRPAYKNERGKTSLESSRGVTPVAQFLKSSKVDRVEWRTHL